MQVSAHHFSCIILPVSVLGTEILSEMDFGTKLFLWAFIGIFVRPEWIVPVLMHKLL